MERASTGGGQITKRTGDWKSASASSSFLGGTYFGDHPYYPDRFPAEHFSEFFPLGWNLYGGAYLFWHSEAEAG
jgi:hypothetical protein